MGVERADVGESLNVKERLLRKTIAVGDLAAVALARGWAKQIFLSAIPNLLYIDGKFEFDPLQRVHGYWHVKKKRYGIRVALPLVSEGFWSLGYSHVKVGHEKIEVVIDGEPWVSRTNICGMLERMSGDKHVVVHIVGTVRANLGTIYTAFRCSEWLLPLLPEPMFERFAFDKRNVYNDITGRPVQFWDVFIRRGQIVKVLVNASCEEYADVVRRLYKVYVKCER
jgi:hypothetical protein